MSVIVKGGGGKSSGLYVWKKREYTPEEQVTGLSFDLTYTRGSTAYISNQNYDTSRIKEEDLIDFYDGFSCTQFTLKAVNGILHFHSYGSDATEANYVGHDKIVVKQSFNSTDTVTYICSTAKTLPAAIGDFVDFVVSDSPTAYPDGGIHTDGYWYEKVLEGIDFGEITLATEQETVTVAHKLGIIPSFVALVPKSVPSLPSKCIYLVANNTAFYGAGGLVKGGFSPTKTDTQIRFGSIYISGYNVNTKYPAWNYYWFAIA